MLGLKGTHAEGRGDHATPIGDHSRALQTKKDRHWLTFTQSPATLGLHSTVSGQYHAYYSPLVDRVPTKRVKTAPQVRLNTVRGHCTLKRRSMGVAAGNSEGGKETIRYGCYASQQAPRSLVRQTGSGWSWMWGTTVLMYRHLDEAERSRLWQRIVDRADVYVARKKREQQLSLATRLQFGDRAPIHASYSR